MTQRDTELGAPVVTDAIFVPAGQARGRMHVQVLGEGFLARAAPLRARLGSQLMTRVVVRSDGRGFAGILERMPRDGDRLHVGYADAELEPTDIVYRSEPEPVA